MAVPDAGATTTLRDVPLSDSWKIGGQLPREVQKHATVYLVLDKTGLPVEGLEAHAFVLDDTLPKIRKHRLRCIKRMTLRTRLEIKVQDTLIIVISTSPVTDNRALEKDGTTTGSVILENGPKSDTKVAAKTPYKQESARIRQRERRIARRSGKLQQHSDTSDSEQNRMEAITLDHPETGFATFLVLLWILYDEKGTMKEQVPPAHCSLVMNMGGDSLCESLEIYLKQTTDIELESPADMEPYLKARRGEMILLRRYLARVPSAEKYHHEKLEKLLREQIQYQETSEEWRQIEYSKVDAALELRIVLHAKTALPPLLASQKSRIESVERKRSLALKNLASAELSQKRGRLVHNVTRYEAWAQTIFPVSHARADLLRQLEGAKIALAVFDSEDYPRHLT